MARAGQQVVPEKVREGRRACHWWWYSRPDPNYRPNHAARSRGPSSGWEIQTVKPKRKYGVAAGSQGNKKRKVHIVRNQFRAIKPGYPEAILTFWKCGTYTFEAKLQSEAPEKVCYQCFMRDQNQTTVTL